MLRLHTDNNFLFVATLRENYGEMTMDQLKKELRKRNARVSGRKEDLVNRSVYHWAINGT